HEDRGAGNIARGRILTMRLGLFVLVGLLTVSAAPAQAGIADSPLPVLLPGSTMLHVYSVIGVIGAGGGLGTYFSCTSTDTAPIQVGVELFGATGGAPSNNAVTSSLSVAPGATVVFGTVSPVAFIVDSTLGILGNGSARILSTSKKLACTAFV